MFYYLRLFGSVLTIFKLNIIYWAPSHELELDFTHYIHVHPQINPWLKLLRILLFILWIELTKFQNVFQQSLPNNSQECAWKR